MVVGDHVVEFTGDPGPLFENGVLGALLLGRRELLGQPRPASWRLWISHPATPAPATAATATGRRRSPAARRPR